MEFDLGKRAAGAHNADHKEQNQQGKTYRLYRTVNIDNHIPNRAALKLCGRLRDKLPYLG